MKLTANEARELSSLFRDVSVALGNYRFANWGNLSQRDREAIEGIEWTLLNYSSDFTTLAVGLTLDETDASLAKIKQATNKAKASIKRIKNIKKVIGVAGAVVKLGAAIVTQNPGVIASAIGDVIKAVTANNV